MFACVPGLCVWCVRVVCVRVCLLSLELYEEALERLSLRVCDFFKTLRKHHIVRNGAIPFWFF